MKRLDRYVFRGFVVALASTLLLVLVLYMVLNAFQRLDNYVEYGRHEGAVVAVGVILRYYLARFLAELAVFSEIVAVIPAVLVVAAMARANEFVAPLAAGRSLRRLALPVFAGCALVGVLAFVLQNVAGPGLVRQAFADRRRIDGRAAALGSSLSVQGRSGTAAVAVSVERYDPGERRAEGFQACVIEASGDAPFVDIRAPVAVWDPARRAWGFPEGARRWAYGPAVTEGGAFKQVDGFPTALGPDLLEAEELGSRVLGLGALFRQRARPEFASAFHRRLAQMLAPLALALAAVPFVLTTDRSRIFHAGVLAALVTVGYEVAARGFAAYLPPLLGGWLAPAGFAALGVWRLRTMDT
ncbi:MAG: LptF/LptG family permease [Planctomycetota bacterium]